MAHVGLRSAGRSQKDQREQAFAVNAECFHGFSNVVMSGGFSVP